jgi:enoyl-CoA hydratase/carnithine racemase
MPDEILFDVAGSVATIRLNRGAKRNALTNAMYARLADILVDLHDNPDVRVVVLTGSQGSFTAGNDLADMMSATDLGPESPPRRFLDALLAAPQVLVVGVCGAAIGIGTTVLLHADLVYATESSVFALPFVHLGLVPEAASTLLLPAAVGHVRAAELMLLGQRFTAAQAHSWGLVNDVVEGGQDELDVRLVEVAGQLAAQPAAALMHTRRLLREHRHAAVALRLEHDGALVRELAATLSSTVTGSPSETRPPTR